MQDTQEYQLKISLCKRCIYIYKDVIRLLGYPSYVTLLESVEHQTLAIIPCEESHAMAFKVPENYSVVKKDMRIWSKGYVNELRERYCVEPGEHYILDGVYVPKHNAVVFRFPQYRSHGFVVYNSI